MNLARTTCQAFLGTRRNVWGELVQRNEVSIPPVGGGSDMLFLLRRHSESSAHAHHQLCSRLPGNVAEISTETSHKVVGRRRNQNPQAHHCCTPSCPTPFRGNRSKKPARFLSKNEYKRVKTAREEDEEAKGRTLSPRQVSWQPTPLSCPPSLFLHAK